MKHTHQMAISVQYNPYNAETAAVPTPADTTKLPTLADQPLSSPAFGTLLLAILCRHAGTDHAKHNAVDASATIAIKIAVRYSTSSELSLMRYCAKRATAIPALLGICGNGLQGASKKGARMN